MFEFSLCFQVGIGSHNKWNLELSKFLVEINLNSTGMFNNKINLVEYEKFLFFIKKWIFYKNNLTVQELYLLLIQLLIVN